MTVLKIIKERRFKAGYLIREELIDAEFAGTNEPMIMKNAYNLDGHYIGRSKDAHFLCVKMGIKPELIDYKHKVCNIGYSDRKKKYYGWSHRAIVGFKIGDKIFEEKFGGDKTPFVRHGRETILTLGDARKSAINFANYIG